MKTITNNENLNSLLALKGKFAELHGKNPDFYVSAPGRVNLIGEHIDYSLFSVMPMAIQRDIKMAVGISDQLQIANVDEAYPARVLEDLNPTDHDWSNFFLNGFKSVNGKVKLAVVMEGNVPAVILIKSGSWFIFKLGICVCICTCHSLR
jgi:galactokinase